LEIISEIIFKKYSDNIQYLRILKIRPQRAGFEYKIKSQEKIAKENRISG